MLQEHHLGTPRGAWEIFFTPLLRIFRSVTQILSDLEDMSIHEDFFILWAMPASYDELDIELILSHLNMLHR